MDAVGCVKRVSRGCQGGVKRVRQEGVRGVSQGELGRRFMKVSREMGHT